MSTRSFSRPRQKTFTCLKDINYNLLFLDAAGQTGPADSSVHSEIATVLPSPDSELLYGLTMPVVLTIVS